MDTVVGKAPSERAKLQTRATKLKIIRELARRGKLLARAQMCLSPEEFLNLLRAQDVEPDKVEAYIRLWQNHYEFLNAELWVRQQRRDDTPAMLGDALKLLEWWKEQGSPEPNHGQL